MSKGNKIFVVSLIVYGLVSLYAYQPVSYTHLTLPTICSV